MTERTPRQPPARRGDRTASRGAIARRRSGMGLARGQSRGGATPQRVAAAYAGLDELARRQRREPPGPLTLARMRALVGALGDPQRRYPSIHVTGTNGKGSAATMIAALLSSDGRRVGRYTSPHLHDLTERVVIGRAPVSAPAFAIAVERVLAAAQDVAITPTWFEAITAAALWIFAEQSVDVAVIEVGRLGRWDATNVVDGEVAVITNVELDHTDVAGHSRYAIARQKAGIIRPGCTLVLGEPDPSLRKPFVAEHPGRLLTLGEELAVRRRRTDRHGSLVDLETPRGLHRDVRVGMRGAHQCRNALLAVAAVEAFTGTALAPAAASAVLSRTQLPGRIQTVHGEPLILVDGAHNPAAAAALRAVLDESFPTLGPRILLYGALAERDPRPFLRALRVGEFDAAVITEPPSIRAVPPIALRAAINAHVPTHVVTPVGRALGTAQTLAGRSGLVVATGSLYLAAALTSMPGAEASPRPVPELSVA